MNDSAFSQTLRYITRIKLVELERQRSACREYVQTTLDSANAAPSALERVSVLLKAIKEWKGLGALVSADIALEHYDARVQQAKFDPSISSEQINEWVSSLESQLRQAVTRYDYAKLFGDLLEEWLQSGDSLALASPPEDATEAVETRAKAVREERAKEQEMISNVIFSAKSVNVSAIKEYLEDLFSEPDATVALNALRKTIRSFGENFRKQEVDTDEMRSLINSLLVRDLLTPTKAATLKSFLDSDVIIEEVTSVLNMQMASLDSWAWPEEGVEIDMRRELSGKYRAYMDTEIVQALLIQHIGIHFSVTFKQAFRAVVESRAWKRGTPLLTRAQLKRREEHLKEPGLMQTTSNRGRGRGGRSNTTTSQAEVSIEHHRRKKQLDTFFMSRLPSEIEEEDPYNDDPQPGDKANTGMNSQQALLRLISAEAHLSNALHGQCTIMRADLELFGPSLSHDAILTVLRFFGVPEDWLGFFKRWLNAPLRFPGATTPQTRTCGVPIAHALSVLFGESILFGMDFAVNQRAGGLWVYRIYDDFWYSHHDSSECAVAWTEMKKYADLFGLNFNMKKTGGVCINGQLNKQLPQGSVGWGFLVLDSEKGRFVIDQKNVDVHIKELKRQLDNAKSVFGYVNALNKYLLFFRRNFAQPAHCFGRVHADEILSTLARIQREVFAAAGESIVQQIQTMVKERFGVEKIPEGWCFMPVAEGGLEIANPIVDTLTVRDNLTVDPSNAFVERKKSDEEDYQTAKEQWESGAGDGEGEFMSWDEFILGRESASRGWGDTFEHLQAVANPVTLARTGVANSDNLWYSRPVTLKWLVSLYADEIIKTFGSMKIVEPTLIPTGMLAAFKNAKVAWDS